MTLKVNQKHTKIPAFTMIDMITGMVIMSIIISLIFHVFAGFNKQIQSYSSSKSSIIAINLLKSELDNQILKSEKIIEKPTGFLIVTKTSEVKYEQQGKSLVRRIDLIEENIYDYIKKIDLKTFSNQNNLKKEELVSEILIDVLVDAKDLKLYLYKQYSNQEKINFSILNETR